MDDFFVTSENTLLSENVLTNDGRDFSPGFFFLNQVNGNFSAIGTQITLRSGALLTLNNDGTFDYDPNGAFDFLNTGESTSDSFTYSTVDTIEQQVDTFNVTITINGVSDNLPPTITTPVTVTVAENQTAVLDIEATDDLDVEGDGLTYSLTGGADQDLFAIDSDTGLLSFLTAPDFENPGDTDGDNNYQVQVTVTDSSGLTAVQDLTVTVADDPNDNTNTLLPGIKPD